MQVAVTTLAGESTECGAEEDLMNTSLSVMTVVRAQGPCRTRIQAAQCPGIRLPDIKTGQRNYLLTYH